MKKIATLVLIFLVFWGCKTISKDYKAGYEASMNRDYDKAIEFYKKAILNNPNNSVYRMALQRAKIAASLFHYFEAKRFAAQGKKDEALDEYELALTYDPGNRRSQGGKAETDQDRAPLHTRCEQGTDPVEVPTAGEPPLHFSSLGKICRSEYSL